MIHARPFGTLPTSPIAPSMPGELSYPPLDPGRLEAFFVAFGGEMRRREGADGLIDLLGSHQVPARAQYLRQLVSSLPDAVIIIVAPVAAVPALKRLCIAAVKSLHLAKPVHIEIRSREEHYHSIGKKCWELEMMFGHDDSEAHDYDARGSGQAMLNDGSDISDDDTAEPREIEDHAGILKIDENVAAEMDRVLGTTRSMSLPGRRLPESCARGE
ncbi:uncharacterized protein CcaverHIS019_0309670 [Cutaneotrichosporon cavernicola]|uniref:Uncharacterized protein n=1 Tax=Cutaneotrichosporon cavernicola TaxID=279322 RepID=A0AA48I7V5_9TREE|nr:uncharacterized protein CcaverHIS019_0309670 [Cutaneotrichosporon cavernicola]BEI90897.1 hypothetical protein CcaverHIS019_0309670 [Cutaneotrichosporon cavernicola]BEJ06446.1 hypothetical protein CcaverHIS641_0309680 [Cutaneotrichosporon cavernicola]